MARGRLTDKVIAEYKAQFGKDSQPTLNKIRLMPYLQYVATNSENIDRSRVRDHELNIIEQWKIEGYIAENFTGLYMTKEFSQKINAVIWAAYVEQPMLGDIG